MMSAPTQDQWQQNRQFNHPSHTPTPAANGVAPQANHAPRASTQQYQQLEVYGKKCALQVKLDETASNHWQTIRFETALRNNPSNPRDKTYNWAAKMAFQLTLNELPLFLAVMILGYESLHLGNHGPDNKKQLTIKKQNTGFFFNFFDGVKGYNVPVSMIDGLNIANWALAQYKSNFNGVEASTLLKQIGTTMTAMRESGSFPFSKG